MVSKVTARNGAVKRVGRCGVLRKRVQESLERMLREIPHFFLCVAALLSLPALPFSPQAYRDHPLYVLERWLRSHEVLRPRGPVLGVCKGLPVFPRSCVAALRSSRQWRRQGRREREGEERINFVVVGGWLLFIQKNISRFLFL